MRSRGLKEARSVTSLLSGILSRRDMLRKPLHMSHDVILQRGQISMWSVGNGDWQARNVKTVGIKSNWSECLL